MCFYGWKIHMLWPAKLISIACYTWSMFLCKKSGWKNFNDLPQVFSWKPGNESGIIYSDGFLCTLYKAICCSGDLKNLCFQYITGTVPGYKHSWSYSGPSEFYVESRPNKICWLRDCSIVYVSWGHVFDWLLFCRVILNIIYLFLNYFYSACSFTGKVCTIWLLVR